MTPETASPPALAPQVRLAIAELSRRAAARNGLIRQTAAISNRVGGQLRGALGWKASLPADERERIRKRAVKIIKAVLARNDVAGPDAEITDMWRGAILCAHVAVEPFERERADVERRMRKAARHLPAYSFAKSVRGLGDLAFAIVVANCRGEHLNGLSDFANPAKVWKRMGLGFATPEEDAAQQRQIHKRRRADAFVFLYDTLLRQQWIADKDEDGKDPKKTGKPIAAPAHPTGVYGEVYGAAKARYLLRVEASADLPAKIGDKRNPEKWTPKRADMAARRFMAKRLLRDLWRAWRDDIAAHPEKFCE